jgi:capsular exopolysaccharide synthesis family protein
VLLGSPVLGVVHAMSRRQSVQQRGQMVAREATSNVAEAFRTVRTGVFFSVPQEQARSIQVTSAMPGEGKSTVTSNLGIAMAQAGRRVLIIDGDLRRPTQHLIFDVSGTAGLTAVLAGLRPLRELIVHTSISGLDLLPCGREAPNPAEMLGTRSFKVMLEKLKTRYHRILIDSPPVSPVADATILAAVCDATLFVVHAQKSTQGALLRARDALAGVNARIIGCVVNEAHAHREGYSTDTMGLRERMEMEMGVPTPRPLSDRSL